MGRTRGAMLGGGNRAADARLFSWTRLTPCSPGTMGWCGASELFSFSKKRLCVSATSLGCIQLYWPLHVVGSFVECRVLCWGMVCRGWLAATFSVHTWHQLPHVAAFCKANEWWHGDRFVFVFLPALFGSRKGLSRTAAGSVLFKFIPYSVHRGVFFQLRDGHHKRFFVFMARLAS